MSTPNAQLIQKQGALALGDLAPGGELVPKQARRFLKIALKRSVLSARVRSPLMTNPEEKQPKLLWTGQVLHAATSGEALPYAQRSKPTMDEVVLNSKLMKGVVHVHREVFEDNVERQALENTLVRFMAERVSLDLENALINGDTTDANDLLALQDGVLKLASSNILDANVSSLSADILSDLIQTLPEEFEVQPNLTFFTNRKARSDYRESLRNRQTAIGDSIITGAAQTELGYDGISLVKVPLFPNNLNAGGGSNETNVLYCDPQNIVYGFQRRVTLQREFKIEEQVWVVVVTCRSAINFEHEPAVAKATEVIGQ